MRKQQELFTVGGTADIRSVATIHRRLIEAFESSDTIVVDVEHADGFDASFLQLIEAARMHAAATSKTLSLANPASGELREQLARGGFLSRTCDRAFWLQSGEVV